MRPRASEQRNRQPHGKAAMWLAILFAVVTVVWTVTMIASLHWRFLDKFVLGAAHGIIGIDFFQIPRGYANLLLGNNIFLTETGTYGPDATMYLNHPFVAVAVGPWTAPLAPWPAFWLFVVVSLGLLLLSARLVASAFEAPAYRGFAYFAIFCSLPTYLMLWNAQAHVFLIVAVALILGGLMRLEQEPQSEKLYCGWIQLGLLIALLSKPVVILMLPVLFLLPETRRKLLLPVAIYAAVSLLFLVVGDLNPAGYNGVHWLNIVGAGSGTRQFLNRIIPMEFDLLDAPGLYSLPIFVGRIFGHGVPSLFFRIPLVAILVMSLSPLVLAEREQRLRAVLVTVSLCILSHFLCYYAVQEYHYTTLLPTLPVMLWLWQRESVPWFRGLLLTSFVVSLLVFLPTPCFLDQLESPRFENINQLQRVVPVALAFLCLTVYGVASTWLRRRRPNLITSQMIGGIWPAARLGGTMAILFGSVLAAVCLTVPSRLLRPFSKWTARDFAAHYDETIAQLQRSLKVEPTFATAQNFLGVALGNSGRIEEAMAQFERTLKIEPNHSGAHYNLGLALQSQGKLDEAIAHYQQAVKIKPNKAAGRCTLGLALRLQGRIDEAIAQYRQAVRIKPSFAEAHTGLALALVAGGRCNEAVAQLEQAVQLKPNNLEAQTNLAWLRATCADPSLRNGAAAIEHAQRANQLCGGRRADVLNTLAAAYAEAGRFPETVAAARKALELAAQQNDHAWVGVLRSWIALYEAGKPYRQMLSASAPPPKMLAHGR
jgi:tetratricopeptide (TPR) repeat protein